jgi:hypothetical protein
MLRRVVVAVLVMVLGAAIAVAQGTSPIKVTGISVSPTSFNAGNAVTITVKLKNGGTASYGCAGTTVAVYIFKDQPYTVTNQVWQAQQPLGAAMAAGSTRSITFTAKWTVPAGDTPTYHIMAWSPVCAPDEFGQNSVVKINRTCVYKYVPKYELVRMSVRDRLPITP